MNDFSIMNSEFYIPLSKRSKKNGLRVKITSSRSPPIGTFIKYYKISQLIHTQSIAN